MISQIFYSQVLFPSITYDNWIDFWNMKLKKIEELCFWKIKTTFICKENSNYFHVYFLYKDLTLKENINTKEWYVYWDESPLVKDVISRINNGVKNQTEFSFFKDKKFYDKIPFWVVLTITSKCNIFCNYCFNDYDYPLKDRNLRKGLSWKDYKKIIDILYESWTRDIILTWWEPFIAPYFWELLDYLKEKNIFTRVNTNWTLLSDETLKRLNDNYVVNLMVSIHEFNQKDYFKVNEVWAINIQWLKSLKNFEDKFYKKIVELRKIKNYKNLSLDIMTILDTKNILNLEKIYEFILSNFEVEDWHFFRLYSTWTTSWISRPMISLAIAKLYKLNKIYKRNFKIVDSVPYCASSNPEIASKVIDWELSENHNVKTIITTDWFIQIMSAFDTNLGNILEEGIENIWRWNFVQKMLNHWFLPKQCQDCLYKDSCRWGSRMDANIYNWSYDAWDPLWDVDNKVIW